MNLSSEVEEVSAQLLACLPTFDEEEQRAAVAIYRQLAEGAPLRQEQLAKTLGVPRSEVAEVLGRQNMQSMTYADESGNIIGFGGLAVVAMPHKFTVEGRALYTWCAWDSLFIPRILGQQAEVETTCPETSATVRVTVGARGVEKVIPSGARMSFLVPDPEVFGEDVHRSMERFCHFVYFFASSEAATTWTSKIPKTVVLALEEAFELGDRMNTTRWGSVLGVSGRP
jgi:alkylmercury lyase